MLVWNMTWPLLGKIIMRFCRSNITHWTPLQTIINSKINHWWNFLYNDMLCNRSHIIELTYKFNMCFDVHPFLKSIRKEVYSRMSDFWVSHDIGGPQRPPVLRQGRAESEQHTKKRKPTACRNSCASNRPPTSAKPYDNKRSTLYMFAVDHNLGPVARPWTAY